MRRPGTWMVLLVLLGWTATASAQQPSCGAAIETDTTLEADLVCPDNALRVAASGVTIDLAGHEIEGVRRGFGITVSHGLSGVTITNGSVRGFHNAIVVMSGSAHVIRKVGTYDSHDGILLNGVRGVLVDRVEASGNDGSGIHTPVSHNVTVRRSHIHDNAAGIGGVGLDTSVFTRNVVERNTFYGFYYLQAYDNVFTRNAVFRNGGMGLRLEDQSTGNRLERNDVSVTTGDGIVLTADTGPNVLLRNRAKRNTGDGIAVLAGGTTLVRNSALRNGGLGINAPAGTLAARRNTARRNGDARQCVGVPCR